jgi:hypothetical protein
MTSAEFSSRLKIIMISLLIILNSCITEFIPKTTEDKNFLVVDGMITDRPGVNTVKLSRSFPLGGSSVAAPVTGYNVIITDDIGNTFNLKEKVAGIYVTDSSEFKGTVGRTYTLHIYKNSFDDHIYKSFPVEMTAVPPVDSIFYEKVTLAKEDPWTQPKEGCNIYLNTHDSTGQCRYFRWEYIETWEFIIPYNNVKNNRCWVSANSDLINIKNTSVITEDKIEKFLLNYISNETDRLKNKYSILVNQYSIGEEEYNYWEELQKLSEKSGSLYDIIPSSVANNLYCLDDPNVKVLGYFSVSAMSSKRIFIKDNFKGLVDLYSIDNCGVDTILVNNNTQNIDSFFWVIGTGGGEHGNYWLTTPFRRCADCTTRGTKTKPDFWIGE